MRRILLIAAIAFTAAVAWHGCARTLELGLTERDAGPDPDAGEVDGSTTEMEKPDTDLDASVQDGSVG